MVLSVDPGRADGEEGDYPLPQSSRAGLTVTERHTVG